MRVFIRAPKHSDAAEFLAKTRQSIGFHRPWVAPPTSLQGYETYLRQLDSDAHEGLLICRVSDEAIVGLVNVNEITRGCLQSAYVGYWSMDGFQGFGYMTEGLALVFDYAFDVLGLHRLEVNIQPTNTPSIALAKRLGMTMEGFSKSYLKVNGEWKDHQRWAMLADDWAARGGTLWFLGHEAIAGRP